MHTFCARRSRCFLFQTQNHRSLRVTTSRKQQRTKEERSVLLNNNRWICLLPFARKPDPRRVSKLGSREPPQAWLFGLVRSAPQAERKAPQASQFSAPQAGKIARSICCDLPALLARLLLALLSQSSASGRSLFTRRTAERGRKSFSCRISCESVCGFFFLLPPRHQGHTGARRTDPRPPQAAGHLLGRPSVALLGRHR